MLKSRSADTPSRRRKATQTNYGEQHPRGLHTFAWAVLGVVVRAIVAFFALIAIRGYPAMPVAANGYPMYGWWFFPFGIFFFLIFIFFIARLVFWPWGWRRRYGYGYHYGDPHEILRQRYARGEITKEQFDQMTRDLEQHH